MYDVLFTFHSLTAAQRGRAVCGHHGISGAVIRAPLGLSTKGCGYGLRVGGQMSERAALVMRLEGADFERAYRLAGGRTEEVAL